MAKATRAILDIRVKRSQGYYTAYIPELGVTDYAKTKKLLAKSLQKAISLALEDMVESGNLDKRKLASKIVSESIMSARIPVGDIGPLTNAVGNILASAI